MELFDLTQQQMMTFGVALVAAIFVVTLVLWLVRYLKNTSQDRRIHKIIKEQSEAFAKEVILSGYEVIEQQFNLDDYADAERPHAQELTIEKRKGNFDEVEPCMPEKAVKEECKRCLRCDLEWLQTFSLPLKAKPDRLATEEEFAAIIH